LSADAGVGLVAPHEAVLCAPPDELYLHSGRILGPVTVAYETYGTLSPSRDNAVLVCHALSGDAHAAGNHPDDPKPGWWDPMIGPGRAIDTERYFVVCPNVLGSCKGTTGPASINPRTGHPYAMKFPVITIRDMVRVQALLLDHLGIDRLHCVIGGSMGGMQALEWAVRYPHRVRSAVPISTTGASSPLSIGFNKIGRRAVMSDPNWRDGNYYGTGESPRDGLAVARMIGHLTFMSDSSMRAKFGRRISGREGIYALTAQYDVERYLHYNGYKFTEHFDPNSYLYLTKALDTFDLGDGFAGGLEEALAQIRARLRFITFTSDWLYPPLDTEVMEVLLRRLGKTVDHVSVPSNYGHDAFLVEYDSYTHRVAEFLDEIPP
jgi:homoserine O-acetyltransferase